jgi:hypothetical protein
LHFVPAGKGSEKTLAGLYHPRNDRNVLSNFLLHLAIFSGIIRKGEWRGQAMGTYQQIPIEQISIDKENPRIANYLAIHDPASITSDTLALLLGTTTSACESLRESIKENKGIIHPIIVNKESDGTYRAIEGNTRLQIYKDFLKNGVPGDWSTIKAVVYDLLDSDRIHAIRLQAHLIGPRDWDPYSKAKYLNYLYNVEYMPMNTLLSFCGGSSKATEIKNMISAYNDMEEHYRPICDDDAQFDIKKFHGFVELQRKAVLDSIILNGYTKHDFSQWIQDEKISVLQDVRRIPDILKSKKATEVFLRENSTEAKKILAIEEITSDKLKDVPYELLARELSKRMLDISVFEIRHLRDDTEYFEKLQSLRNVCDDINSYVLSEIDGE